MTNDPYFLISSIHRLTWNEWSESNWPVELISYYTVLSNQGLLGKGIDTFDRFYEIKK